MFFCARDAQHMSGEDAKVDEMFATSLTEREKNTRLLL